jgi:plastocyanin
VTGGGGAGQGGSGRATAVVQFGKADVGSPFPPDSGHDQSGHAKDDLVPRTVVISEGGTVTFNVPPGVHQIAIYEPGTDPGDINTSIRTTLAAAAGCAGPPVVNAPLVINDPDGRVATLAVPCFQPTQVSFTFPTAGKYLVICSFVPHFEVGMYGWVDVKE